MKALRSRYRVEFHFDTRTQSSNAGLTVSLGLREYLTERFAIIGTPEEGAQRIKQLAELGVTQIWTPPSFKDKLGFITAMGPQVFPKVK